MNLTLFFQICYLLLPKIEHFFLNTFWTKFVKNGHCALLRYLYWTKSNSV